MHIDFKLVFYYGVVHQEDYIVAEKALRAISLHLYLQSKQVHRANKKIVNPQSQQISLFIAKRRTLIVHFKPAASSSQDRY